MLEISSFKQAVGATDIGQRTLNEDAFLVDRQFGLMLVADGVGGHQAGEVASAQTAESIARALRGGAGLVDAVRAANREVRAEVESGRGKAGMASTVVATLFDREGFEVAWVGDSRAYLWDGRLKLITRDHSLMEILVATGKATQEEVRDHPKRNVIVQAIGLQSEDDLVVGHNSGTLRDGEILLLCSDGMSDVLEPIEISQILDSGDSLQEKCDRLVSTSIRSGGQDNSTVILVSGNSTSSLQKALEAVWTYDPELSEFVDSGVAEEPPELLAGFSAGGSRCGDERPQATRTEMLPISELDKALGKKPLSDDSGSGNENTDGGGKRRSFSAAKALMLLSILGALATVVWFMKF